MNIKELINKLKRYKDNTKVIFKIVPPEEVSDDDIKDIAIDWYGEIGTSLLDSDTPVIEFGFQYQNQEDWNKEWKDSYDEYYNDERGY